MSGRAEFNPEPGGDFLAQPAVLAAKSLVTTGQLKPLAQRLLQAF
jgi:hypothetical protein